MGPNPLRGLARFTIYPIWQFGNLANWIIWQFGKLDNGIILVYWNTGDTTTRQTWVGGYGSRTIGIMELVENQLPGHQGSQGLTRCMVLWGGFEGLL